MIEAMIIVAVSFLIGIILGRVIIKWKDKKSLINGINAACEEHADFLNRACDDIHENFSDEKKEILIEGAGISFNDSKSNLITVVKDIYFAPILYFKLPLKRIISYLDKFFEKDSMPRDMNGSLLDLEKRDIGSGLYLYYFLKYILKYINMQDDTIKFIHTIYIDSLKFTDFYNLPTKDPFGKLYSTHINGVLYNDKNNNYHICFQDDYYMKRSNFLSLSRFIKIDNEIREDKDKDQFLSLLHTDSEKDLKKYKNEYYSEGFKKKFGPSFNDILDDDEKLPIWHIVDKPLEFGKFAKVLMYLDLDKKKIKFKEFVKDSDNENYHTIRNKDEYAGLWIYEYVMYLESYIYFQLDTIFNMEEN